MNKNAEASPFFGAASDKRDLSSSLLIAAASGHVAPSKPGDQEQWARRIVQIEGLGYELGSRVLCALTDSFEALGGLTFDIVDATIDAVTQAARGEV